MLRIVLAHRELCPNQAPGRRAFPASGAAGTAERDFGDEAERAEGADEQLLQIIAGDVLGKGSREPDEAAVRQYRRHESGPDLEGRRKEQRSGALKFEETIPPIVAPGQGEAIGTCIPVPSSYCSQLLVQTCPPAR